MDYSEPANKKRKNRRPPHATRVKNSAGIMIFRVLFAVLLIGAFGIAGAGIGVYLGILRNAPEINVTDLRPGVYTSFIIEERTGTEIARLSGDQNRVFVPISQMPQHLLDAFIAIEDERFLSHNGIDPRGMIRALRNNLTTNRTEGASTITQQLIKNILVLPRNDLISKLQEQYLAIQFELKLAEIHGSREAAKEVILESYLNMISLGRNWNGVQVAAWNYFGKDVSELTISESAVIASITRNPSRYLPDRFPQHNRERQILVLEKMLELGMITQEEHDEAYDDPVHDRVQSEMIAEMAGGVTHSYFVDAVIEQVVADLMEHNALTREMAFGLVYGGGLRIYVTQDLRMQEIVDDVFADPDNFPVDVFQIDIEYRLSTRNTITGRTSHHHRQGSVTREDQIEPWIEAVHAELLTANDVIVAENQILMPQPQAAFVIMDQHNGHVLALSGGRGEKVGNRNFCRATVATRSPGSQFKVLAAFLPGIDTGTLTAATHIVDEPWYFDDGHTRYEPRNWWNSGWEGAASIRRAIYRSMNVVSARAFQEVGPEIAFQYLQRLGFTTLEGTLANGREFRDTGAAVPLGGLTLGVTQLELAAAYATIANAGEYNKPVFYTRVLNNNGHVILENTLEPERVISAPTAYILTDMMRDTMRASGATGHQGNFRSQPIAGKTGTSQNVEDLGFTGYTPYFTASVWLGFDTPRALQRVSSSAHLVIWRNIMEQIHTELELPERSFTRPDGVVSGTVCRVSGLLPTEQCRRAGLAVSDLFVVGTLPTVSCPGHGSSETWLCEVTNRPISDYCPPQFWRRGIPQYFDMEQCDFHGPYNSDGFLPGEIWFPELPTPAPEHPWSDALITPEPTLPPAWEPPIVSEPESWLPPDIITTPPPSGAELEDLLPMPEEDELPGWF